MPSSGNRVLNLKILPDVDKQGMGKVHRAIREGLAAGLDSKTAKSFESMASNAATEFNTIIAQAKMTGLRKEADRWQSQMNDSQNALIKAVKEMGDLQQRVGKDLTQDEYAAQSRRIKEEMEALNDRISREMAATQMIVDRRKKALADAEDRMAKGSGEAMAEAFGDSVSDVWGKITSKDLAGLTRSLGGALKKASEGLETKAAMGGRGAGMLGGLGKSLGALAGTAAALAAVVAAIAAVAKIAMDADAQAKEFNSTLLQGASSADFMSKTGADGFTNLSKHLNNARDAAFSLSYQFRTAPKEILDIVSAANEAGLTFKEMQTFVGKDVDEMKAFAEVSRTALVYSKQLGQSTDTIATQSAEWAHDLGMGLKDVQSGFDAIFTASQKTGFGVKRFYSAVTVATSNMAMYNMRVEEAAGLVATLSKSLGETNAGKFVEGLTKGFADESYTERFKRMIIAGKGDMQEIMGNSAKDTAKAFQDKFGAEIPDAMREAAKKAGVNIDAALTGDPKALAKLGQMSEDQIRSVLQTAKTPEQYRELEKLVNLTQGMSGGLQDQAKALDAMDMGGKLATILAGGLGGKELSKMSAIELAAFESYAGVSGEQLVMLRKMDRQLRGEFSEIQAATKAAKENKALTETQQGILDRQNLELRKMSDGTYKAFVKGTDKSVDSFNDYAQGQGDMLKAAVEGGMTKQEAMAKEIVSNTASITSWLETGMQHMLEKIADILQGIYDLTAQINPELREAKDKIVQEIETQQASLVAAQQSDAQIMSDLQMQASQAKPEDQAAIQQQIADLQNTMTLREIEIQRYQKAGKKARDMTPEGAGWGLIKELAAGGTAGTMTGMGLKSMLGGSGILDQLGLAGTDITDKFDVGEEMTKAQYLSLDATEKARKIAENAAKKTEEGLQNVDGSIQEASEAEAGNVAKGLLMANALQAAASMGITDPDQAAAYAAKLVDQGMEAMRKTEEEVVRARMERPPSGARRVDDFIYRGGEGGGTVTPIHKADEFLGAKPGGPVAEALGGGRNVQNIFNINGNDKAAMYAVVVRALREAGLRPPSGRG